MNKKQLVDDYANKMGLSKKQAQESFDYIIDALVNRLKHDEEFSIPGFGKFVVKNMPAQVRRNPATGASINVPAKNVVRFKASKLLVEKFN